MIYIEFAALKQPHRTSIYVKLALEECRSCDANYVCSLEALVHCSKTEHAIGQLLDVFMILRAKKVALW